MNNHNFFVKILAKLDNLINSQLKKNLNKLNFLFEKDKLLVFLSLKRILIFITVLFISFFSYLSIPHLYNNDKLYSNIKNQLSKNLNLNFNLSENNNYNIFPRPNFIFKDVSFLDKNESIGDIKVYISFKDLLFPNKIKIKDIVFDKMNFYLDKENYDFFVKILENDFSNFTLKIKDSNIFYKNFDNDILFINKIKQLKYFYETKNFENVLLANNEIFNIPYEIEIRDDNVKKQFISRINFDFINISIENTFNYKKFAKDGLIEFYQNQKKSEGIYNYEKNLIKFNFIDKSFEQNFKYGGFISLKPFFSEFSGDINKMNLEIFFDSKSILVQFLKSGLLNNKNLNINTKINSKKTSYLRDLTNLTLNLNISEGLIDVNETQFSLNDYADFIITDSLLYNSENNLILDALISVDIKDFNKIYKIFQTPRNNRKEIKKVEFNLNYNFNQLTANLNNIKINDKIDPKVNNILDEIILRDNNLQNRIYLKNLVNQVAKNYAG